MGGRGGRGSGLPRGGRAGALLALALAALPAEGAGPGLAPPSPAGPAHEPIAPIPAPPPSDPLRVALGEALFHDRRLSGDGSRSCASCHDLTANGATAAALDRGADGRPLPVNTPTVFNAALSFRLNWEGRARTLKDHAAASLLNPAILAASPEDVAARLAADKALSDRFRAAYGREPDAEALVDALAVFEASLLTPDSRFDRWLRGEAAALSPLERQGYDLFKSVGCISCHQGVGVGGNLFQRHGVFEPLASPEPAVVRVPSLRNVAVTAPYFHDGGAATLREAVARMARSQLGVRLSEAEVAAIAAWLGALTGEWRGRPLEAPR